MITSNNLQYYEPHSESRPDLEFDYEIMQMRIKSRKQHEFEKKILAVITAVVIVVAYLGLTIQHKLEETQCGTRIECQL